MDRTVQVGDLARIILPDEIQVYPIELIEGVNIYISSGEGRISLLEPDQEERYYIPGLDIPHQIEFIALSSPIGPNGSNGPVLTGVPFLDLTILADLSDQDLDRVCQLQPYLIELCNRDDFWINRLVTRYGPEVVKAKPPELTLREYYRIVEYPLSSVGANLALVRNDQFTLNYLANRGIQPDINQVPEWFLKLQPNFPLIAQLNETALEFFRTAPLGPQVMASFIFEDELRQLDYSRTGPFLIRPQSLIQINGTRPVQSRLNDLLYFLQPVINGQPNPIYGLITLSYLPVLFNLHAHYAITIIPDPLRQRKFYSVSPAIRTFYGDMIKEFIDRQRNNLMVKHPTHYHDIQIIAENRQQAIYDPHVRIIPSYYPILNPNRLTGLELNNLKRLIIANMIVKRYQLSELDHLNVPVAQSYPVITNQPEHALIRVLLIEGNVIGTAWAAPGMI